MARLARLVQGLRSHPLQEIYRMNVAAASRGGDGFTAFPTPALSSRHRRPFGAMTMRRGLL